MPLCLQGTEQIKFLTKSLVYNRQTYLSTTFWKDARLFTAQPSKAGVCRLHTTYPIVPRMQGGILVGVQGFEPWTPWSQTRCASQTAPHSD